MVYTFNIFGCFSILSDTKFRWNIIKKKTIDKSMLYSYLDEIGCATGTCNCNLEGIQFDGGTISRKNGAPITRIKLPAAPGYRELHIGPVRCYSKECMNVLLKYEGDTLPVSQGFGELTLALSYAPISDKVH